MRNPNILDLITYTHVLDQLHPHDAVMWMTWFDAQESETRKTVLVLIGECNIDEAIAYIQTKIKRAQA